MAELELHDDRPAALKGVIAWLYGLEVDFNGEILYEDQVPLTKV